MDLFHNLLDSRDEEDEKDEDTYETTVSLNIRESAGGKLLPSAPLPQGTEVVPFETSGMWWQVHVPSLLKENESGWVYSKYLEKRR